LIPGARDYLCGYRAYRAGLLRKAVLRFGDTPFAERGFACMVDILIKLCLVGATVNEVPMILRYDRKPGATEMPEEDDRADLSTAGPAATRHFELDLS
jgi:dolichol-phosphate mannosyltransferase